jgi:hypothetical protein
MNIGGWEGLSMSTRWLGMLLGLPLLKWSVGVVFIATIQFVAVGEGCWRWAHRTVRCTPDSVRCASHVILSVEVGAGRPLKALSSCGTGQSGAPLILCSDFCRVYCSALFTVRVDRWREVAVAPLAHRTVRWIIAERPPVFPKLASSEPLLSGAPDTVRWFTGQSGEF